MEDEAKTKRTRDYIELLWSDYELCPDFTPILKDLLDERDALQAKLAGIQRNYGRGSQLPVTDEQYKYLQTEVSGEYVGLTVIEAIIREHKDLKDRLKRSQAEVKDMHLRLEDLRTALNNL